MIFRVLKPFCSLKTFLGFLLLINYMLLVCSLDDPCYYENGPQTLVQAIQSCGTIPQINISQAANSDPLANVYQQLKEIPIQQLWVVVISNQQWTYNIMNLTTSFEVDRQNVIAASQTSGLRLDNVEAIASQTLPAICYGCANYTQCSYPQIMHQNKCYWITTVDGDFNTIDATCSASYGILATIESQATHRLLSIFQESSDTDPTWIGLQDNNADNFWQWSDMSMASFPRDYNGFAQTSSRKKRDDENLFYMLAGYTGTYPQGFTWPTWPSTTIATTQTSKSTTDITTSTTQDTTKASKTTKDTSGPTTVSTSTLRTDSTSSSPTASNSPSTTSIIPVSGLNFTTATSATEITPTSNSILTSASNGTLGNGNFTLTSPTINPSTTEAVAGIFAITPSGCVTNEGESSSFAWSSKNCSSRFKGICVAYQSSCDQTSRYYRGKCYSCPTDGVTCAALQCSTGSPVLVNSSTDPITVLINEMQCYAALGLVNCANVFPVTMCEFEWILP